MKKYYSEIAEIMHKETLADYRKGHISETDMKEMDDLCLLKEGESPKEKTPETEQGSIINEMIQRKSPPQTDKFSP
jgi:DNA-binding transcriptional regulator YiaG